MNHLKKASLILLAGAFIICPPSGGAEKSAGTKAGGTSPAERIKINEELRQLGQAAAEDDPQEEESGRGGHDPKRYWVVNAEFENEQKCNNFQVPGAVVFNRYGRFADMFIESSPDTKSKRYKIYKQIKEQVRKSDGCLWAEKAPYMTQAPPPLPPAAEGDSVPQPQHPTSPPLPGGITGKLSPATEVPSSEEAEDLVGPKPDRIIRGGLDGLTGKGAIVAVIDTGIDFNHDDFITYDAEGKPTSRLLYYWDTSSDAYETGKIGTKAPVSFPNGSPIGTIFSRDDLTKELRSSHKRITTWDTEGHGTSCAGVAAGNGNAAKGKYAGVASEADLIAVKISSKHDWKAYLLPYICGWIDQVAGKRPVVISCSFGYPNKGHDGNTVLERQLDARFPLDKPGRAICVAAGNDDLRPWHAEFKLGADKTRLIWHSNDFASLHIFYDHDKPDDLEFSDANALVVNKGANLDGLPFAKSGPLMSRDQEITPGLIRQKTYYHNLTHQVVTHIYVNPGYGDLTITAKGNKPVLADAYLYGGPQDTGTFFTFAKEGKVLGCPASGANVITVGSYDWNNQFNRYGTPRLYYPWNQNGDFVPMTVGGLSNYSSHGPDRMTNAIKPEIAAPGQFHTAPVPMNIEAESRRDVTERYQMFDGTSAATPYCAGVIALLMEKKPDITLGEIKNLFKEKATKDQFTGKVPNSGWGYGKLDVDAVKRMIDALASK